jgi:hypothetical protein
MVKGLEAYLSSTEDPDIDGVRRRRRRRRGMQEGRVRQTTPRTQANHPWGQRLVKRASGINHRNCRIRFTASCVG